MLEKYMHVFEVQYQHEAMMTGAKDEHCKKGQREVGLEQWVKECSKRLWFNSQVNPKRPCLMLYISSYFLLNTKLTLLASLSKVQQTQRLTMSSSESAEPPKSKDCLRKIT